MSLQKYYQEEEVLCAYFFLLTNYFILSIYLADNQAQSRISPFLL